ncbi:hypothetical protein [Cellulomonas citrea]|uniref:hypothetical protein n=1 Tax=Cellulomonas citrea TaxID=1909423 RepID=UPI00135B176C|nr:hypothetical protein [Cellulomonas citrea]
MRSISARLLARAKDIEDSVYKAYEGAPTVGGYWGMLDLRGSAAYRVAAGDRRSFARARVFSQLLGEIIDAYPGAEVFKELGDGVLLHATDWRTVIELPAVFDAINRYWHVEVDADPSYPSLEARASFTGGECVRVDTDYLGAPIDLVARINGFDPDVRDCIAVVEAGVRSSLVERASLEYPYIQFLDSMALPSRYLKQGEPPRRVSALVIDRAKFGDATNYFVPIRSLLDGVHE